MTKLQFSYNNRCVNIEIGKVNFFISEYNKNREDLHNLLLSIFNGQEDTALYDLGSIKKGDFIVWDVDSIHSIDEELKLGAKSVLYSLVKEKVNEMDPEQLDSIIKEIELKLEPMKTKLNEIQGITGSGRFEIKNMLSLIKEYYLFEDIDELVMSDKRYQYLNLLIEEETKKTKIIITNGFDYYLSITQCLNLIQKVNNYNNIVFIAECSLTEFIKLAHSKYPSYIVTDHIQTLNQLFCDASQSFTGSKYNMMNILSEEEIRDVRSNITNTYFFEILQIYLSDEREKVMEILKNSDLYQKEELDMMESIKKHIDNSSK